MIGAAPSLEQIQPSRGYVLPLVLLFIFVFSAILTIAVSSARNGQRLTSAMEAEQAAIRRAVSAENRAVFRLLTAQPVLGGIDLGASPESSSDPLSGLPDLSGEGNLWPGNGGMRRAGSDAIVVYQDAAGLISLNNTSQAELTTFLSALGIGNQQARQMYARLLDYIDDDDRRRFLGAESPAYRLLRRQPPSHSPLRAIEEIYNVMDWSDALADIPAAVIRQSVTVDLRIFQVIEGMMAPPLARIMAEEDRLERIRRDRDALSDRPPLPSNRARLIIETFFDGADGRVRLRRIMEITRRPAAADRPFDKELIVEYRDDRVEAYDRRNIPALFPATN